MPEVNRIARLLPGDRTVRLGVVGLLVVTILVGVALSAAGIRDAVTTDAYSARFSEVGGLNPGDQVRVAGVQAGTVDAIDLEPGAVVVHFTVDRSGRIGTETGATIRTATVLGTKFLDVEPSGPGALEEGSEIPLARTRSPFDVQQILNRLTRETGELDVPTLARSLGTVADTLDRTPPELRAAISGLTRLSDTIAARDEGLRQLLANANGVTGILAQRSGQITQILADGNLLLGELVARRDAINGVLVQTTAVFNQLNGLVEDNQEQIDPALRELSQVLDLLHRNRDGIAATIEGLRNYAGSLGEAVSGGPWFYGYIPNLAPTNLSQQTLDGLLASLPSGGVTPSPLGNGVLPR